MVRIYLQLFAVSIPKDLALDDYCRLCRLAANQFLSAEGSWPTPVMSTSVRDLHVRTVRLILWSSDHPRQPCAACRQGSCPCQPSGPDSPSTPVGSRNIQVSQGPRLRPDRHSLWFLSLLIFCIFMYQERFPNISYWLPISWLLRQIQPFSFTLQQEQSSTLDLSWQVIYF